MEILFVGIKFHLDGTFKVHSGKGCRSGYMFDENRQPENTFYVVEDIAFENQVDELYQWTGEINDVGHYLFKGLSPNVKNKIIKVYMGAGEK